MTIDWLDVEAEAALWDYFHGPNDWPDWWPDE